MVTNSSNDICPFVSKPLSRCHCFNMTSRNIDSAVHYCVSHFRACEIFRLESGKDKSFNAVNPDITRSIDG